MSRGDVTIYKGDYNRVLYHRARRKLVECAEKVS